MKEDAPSAEIEREKWLLRKYAEREQAALSRGLTRLARYCNEERTHWPTAADLGLISDGVRYILKFTGQRVVRSPYMGARPLWKSFQLLDERMRRLKLVQRVDNLVKRAKHRLSEAEESSLFVLSRRALEGNKDARNLMRDIELLVRNGPSAARNIDWTQHEKALAQFSRRRSVEPARNLSAAPLEVRCYVRVLELIVEDNQRKKLQRESFPLLIWLEAIGHPAASELKRLDPVVAFRVERIVKASTIEKTLRKRELTRVRVRRYRAKNSLSEKRYTTPL
jgi:hypothetical protein